MERGSDELSRNGGEDEPEGITRKATLPEIGAQLESE